MRTETISRTLYTFDELPSDIQEKVIESWRNDDQFFWSDEWKTSLKQFEESFPFVKVTDWCVDPYSHSYVRFHLSVEDGVDEMKGVRLWKWLVNNSHDKVKAYNPDNTGPVFTTIYGAGAGTCPMTGTYTDGDILEPLEKFLRRPDANADLESIITDCLGDWRIAFEKDIEHWYSEECVREDIGNNNHEFTEQGKLV